MAAIRERTLSVEEHLLAFPQALADIGHQVVLVRKILKDWLKGFETTSAFIFSRAEKDSARDEELNAHEALNKEHAVLLMCLKGLVGRSMALHAAGLVLPAALLSAIQGADNLAIHEPHSTIVVLEQMFDDLETTNGDIALWYDAQ